MKNRGRILLALTIQMLPFIGLCQSLDQFKDVTKNPVADPSRGLQRKSGLDTKKTKDVSAPIFDNKKVDVSLRPRLRFTRSGGADSGGGGSGVILNGRLRLKDFGGCDGLPVRISPSSQALGTQTITENLKKFDALKLKEILTRHTSTGNSLLDKLIEAGTARSNWYIANADLALDSDQDNKIAIFKRPIGIVIDEKNFHQLPPLDQLGLLYHESLRMVSLGFNIGLPTYQIERLTCQAFSQKEVDLNQYPNLRHFLASLAGPPPEELQRQRTRLWEISLGSMAQLKDLQMIPWGFVKSFFYQIDSSRFEELRAVFPEMPAKALEEAFFGWAVQEVASQCTGEMTCDYYEVWPSRTLQGQLKEAVRWSLVKNSPNHVVWKSADRAGSDLVIGFSKGEINYQSLDGFCRSLGAQLGYTMSPVSRSDFSVFTNHRELINILNRSNLNAIGSDSDEHELPFLWFENGENSLWTPRPDVEEGFSVLGNALKFTGRGICFGVEKISPYPDKK